LLYLRLTYRLGRIPRVAFVIRMGGSSVSLLIRHALIPGEVQPIPTGSAQSAGVRFYQPDVK
jgi:hypothetical protein